MAEARVLGITLALAAALAVAACSPGEPATPSPGRTPTKDTTMTAAAVRTDREPIAERFPNLGEFVEVHWQGAAAGGGRTGVPGPTDVLIQAVVKLRPEDLSAAKSGYEWQPAPAGWESRLPGELRPFANVAGDWRYNRQFESEVRTDRYSGGVYLDFTSGTVFLDVNSR